MRRVPPPQNLLDRRCGRVADLVDASVKASIRGIESSLYALLDQALDLLAYLAARRSHQTLELFFGPALVHPRLRRQSSDVVHKPCRFALLPPFAVDGEPGNDSYASRDPEEGQPARNAGLLRVRRGVVISSHTNTMRSDAARDKTKSASADGPDADGYLGLRTDQSAPSGRSSTICLRSQEVRTSRLEHRLPMS